MGTGPDGVESGISTTEFWSALVVSVIGLLVTIGIIKPPAPAFVDEIAGLVALVAPQIAYAISRGIRKQGIVAPAPPVVTPVVPQPTPTSGGIATVTTTAGELAPGTSVHH